MKMSYKTENNALNLEAKKAALALAQDLSLARNLAENDEKVRRKALKFLEKYISRKCKEKILSIDNLKIIWKGLFYSMWMSDKPLIQEECAENISNLIHCCSELKEAMNFFKVGLITIQNEWIGIDQHRMDKFYMLVRRLLRQAFVVLGKINFRKQPNECFAQVLEETILSNEKETSLGLFMHFTEIYLEELAKISNGKIQSPRTTDLIKPFIKKIAFASDHRIIEWINKFIFTHLMKQHKLGLEYAEKYQIWKQHGFVGSINDIKKVPITENSDSSEDDDVIEENNGSKEKPLDPRAGRVDVELPQIPFNAKEISQALLELKTHSHTNKTTRKQLVNWSKMFLKLHEGFYPLGMTKFQSKNKNEKFIDTKVSKAAKRLIKFEQQLLASGNNRKRKIKNNLADLEVPINKKIKIDTENGILKKNKGKKIQTVDNLNSSIDEYNYTFERNSGTWFVTKELHTESLSKVNGLNHLNGENTSNIEILLSGNNTAHKKPKKKNNQKVVSKISRLSLNVANNNNNNNKSKIENSRRKTFSPKKVIFNTKLNVSQEMEDHMMQIISSPQIPWDNTKKPGKPLLKSPLKPSPINPFYKLKLF